MDEVGGRILEASDTGRVDDTGSDSQELGDLGRRHRAVVDDQLSESLVAAADEDRSRGTAGRRIGTVATGGKGPCQQPALDHAAVEGHPAAAAAGLATGRAGTRSVDGAAAAKRRRVKTDRAAGTVRHVVSLATADGVQGTVDHQLSARRQPDHATAGGGAATTAASTRIRWIEEVAVDSAGKRTHCRHLGEVAAAAAMAATDTRRRSLGDVVRIAEAARIASAGNVNGAAASDEEIAGQGHVEAVSLGGARRRVSDHATVEDRQVAQVVGALDGQSTAAGHHHRGAFVGGIVGGQQRVAGDHPTVDDADVEGGLGREAGEIPGHDPHRQGVTVDCRRRRFETELIGRVEEHMVGVGGSVDINLDPLDAFRRASGDDNVEAGSGSEKRSRRRARDLEGRRIPRWQ